MALFRKKGPEVVRKSSSEGTVEELKTVNVRGQKVEVRRVQATAPAKPRTEKQKRHKQEKPRARNGVSTSRTQARRASDEEIIVPVESARKQMLVSVSRNQTQIVILEGPVLVEHYVAREDSGSVAGNIYLALIRNVLPGMEAAFLDFGASKNGVLYASDVANPNGSGKTQKRIEQILKEGDEVLVQVTKDAMGAKGARLTGIPSLPGRYLVLVPESDSIGISRRLPDEDRTRLRAIINNVRPPWFGVIVRTAAKFASAEELATDIARV